MRAAKLFAGTGGVAAAMLLLLVLSALFAPLLSAHDPDAINLSGRLAPPSTAHPAGTDELGRDLWARLLYGGRVSLLVGLAAAGISLVLGVILGGLAGYHGGLVDAAISRLVEVMLCFPLLILLLAIVGLFEPGLITIILAIGLTSWTTEARLIRGEILRLREQDYAQAAKALGAGPLRIVGRHLLPNALAPAIVSATFGVASAIMVESALSFLGLGLAPPTASWGSILSATDNYLARAWWLALFPGAAITLTVLALHVLGERLRQVMKPAG